MTHEAKGTTPPGKLLQVLGVAFGLAVLVDNTIGMASCARGARSPRRCPRLRCSSLYALLGALMVWAGARIRGSWSGGATDYRFALALVGISWPIYRLFRRNDATAQAPH